MRFCLSALGAVVMALGSVASAYAQASLSGTWQPTPSAEPGVERLNARLRLVIEDSDTNVTLRGHFRCAGPEPVTYPWNGDAVDVAPASLGMGGPLFAHVVGTPKRTMPKITAKASRTGTGASIDFTMEVSSATGPSSARWVCEFQVIGPNELHVNVRDISPRPTTPKQYHWVRANDATSQREAQAPSPAPADGSPASKPERQAAPPSVAPPAAAGQVNGRWTGTLTFGQQIPVTMEFLADATLELNSANGKVASGRWSLSSSDHVHVAATHRQLGPFTCELTRAAESLKGPCEASGKPAGILNLSKRRD